MNEKLLQYIWNYKLFTHFDFKDSDGNSIEILDFGKWNSDSGPDFLFAKIKINNLILAGNIEIHVKASDWIFHQHSQNSDYQNVILHVVFQNDADILEFKNKNIPTLEIRNYIDEKICSNYHHFVNESRFIPCEKVFSPDKIPIGFHEENLIKKLEEKSLVIEKDLKIQKNNFEAILFHYLAYAFGLKINAAIFKQLAETVDFSVINKIRQDKTQLEALFFGLAGWLENTVDHQSKIWKREFDFLKAKYQLPNVIISPKFLRLRPANFPTIRLSQLADLYFQHSHLFSEVISAKNSEVLKTVFANIKASEYWNDHYNFGKISSVNTQKILSSNFIEIILLNAVLPIKFAYEKHTNEYITDEILEYYRVLAAEKNTVVDGWKNLGIKSENSLESQSLIYHYKNFCETKKCLNCGIGFKILKEPRHV